MSLVGCRNIFGINLAKRLCIRHYQTPAPSSEYTETPEYPEIQDLTLRAKLQRKKEEWHQHITSLPTVEQKLMELNMPKFYGYWSLNFSDTQSKILGVDFCQHATRTHVVNKLPTNYYEDVWSEATTVTPLITDKIEQLIDLNFNTNLNRRNFGFGRANERHKTQNFLFGLHRIVVGALNSVPHINDAHVSLRPRVEAFWFLGGLPPDRLLKNLRKNNPMTKDLENDPMDRPIQGESNPFLSVRVSDGLPEVVSWDDPLTISASVPDNELDPRAQGYSFGHKHATVIPGFWPGEPREHSQIWLHSREFLDKFVKDYGETHAKGSLLQKIVVSSFTQALAHATYLGFGPVTELTYPIVQQSAVTDGQHWNLSVYQLNTSVLHSHHAKDNPRNNILWLGEEEKLFESVDSSGVKGLNTNFLTSLIAMYIKKGVPRENPTPYLGQSFKKLSEHPACEEYRADFLSKLHDVQSNRPPHVMKPEIYAWEKLFKVDHKTRPQESPRRFFERHYNEWYPGNRRLDDQNPAYIPKFMRKDKKVKFKPKIDTTDLYKYD